MSVNDVCRCNNKPVGIVIGGKYIANKIGTSLAYGGHRGWHCAAGFSINLHLAVGEGGNISGAMQ